MHHRPAVYKYIHSDEGSDFAHKKIHNPRGKFVMCIHIYVFPIKSYRLIIKSKLIKFITLDPPPQKKATTTKTKPAKSSYIGFEYDIIMIILYSP